MKKVTISLDARVFYFWTACALFIANLVLGVIPLSSMADNGLNIGKVFGHFLVSLFSTAFMLLIVGVTISEMPEGKE